MPCPQGLQGRLQEERQELGHLLQRQQQRLLQPDVSYRLVPAAFMDAWRAYMGQAGKRTLGKGATAAAVSGARPRAAARRAPGRLPTDRGVLCAHCRQHAGLWGVWACSNLHAVL